MKKDEFRKFDIIISRGFKTSIAESNGLQKLGSSGIAKRQASKFAQRSVKCLKKYVMPNQQQSINSKTQIDSGDSRNRYQCTICNVHFTNLTAVVTHKLFEHRSTTDPKTAVAASSMSDTSHSIGYGGEVLKMGYNEASEQQSEPRLLKKELFSTESTIEETTKFESESEAKSVSHQRLPKQEAPSTSSLTNAAADEALASRSHPRPLKQEEPLLSSLTGATTTITVGRDEGPLERRQARLAKEERVLVSCFTDGSASTIANARAPVAGGPSRKSQPGPSKREAPFVSSFTAATTSAHDAGGPSPRMSASSPTPSSHACRLENCAQAFATRDQLDWHELTHVIDRPHGCLQCPKRFCTALLLSLHRRRVHSNIQLRQGNNCTRCKMRFVRPGNLTRHMKAAHGVEPQDEPDALNLDGALQDVASAIGVVTKADL